MRFPDTEPNAIGIAFPADPVHRERLAELTGMAVPVIADGSVERACAGECGVMVLIGPKLQAKGCPVYCHACGLILYHKYGASEVIALSKEGTK